MTTLKKHASPLKRAKQAFSELINAEPDQLYKVHRLTRLPDGTIRRTEAFVPRKELLKKTNLKTDALIPLAKTEVKALRAALGLSQREFASWLDVSVQAVHKWEQSTGVLGGPILRLLRIVEAGKDQWRKRLQKELHSPHRSSA